MATKLQEVGGLLAGGGNPFIDFGFGLLSAAAPRPVGTANTASRIAEATQFASQRQQQAQQNELIRQQLRQRQQQQQAQQKLAGLLAAPERTPEGQPLPAGQGVLATQDMRQGEIPGLLGKIAPEAVAKGLLAQMFQQPQRPTGTEATLQAVESRVGPLTREQVMQIAGGGTTINVGTSELDEPLSTSDLNRVRLPDGSPVPIGTTPRQAREAGARVFSEAELKRQRDIETAMNTLTTIENLALDPDTGVFIDRGGSFLTNNMLARLGSGILNGLGAFRGTDESVQRSVYNATAQGSIASLVRSMGESGALAEGDVARALSLIPQLGVAPATERQARAQFDELRKLISQGVEKLGGEEAANTFDLGGGATLQWLDD